MFIKEIDKNGMVARQGELKSGDVILKVCIILYSGQTCNPLSKSALIFSA